MSVRTHIHRLHFFLATQIAQSMLLNGPGNLGNLSGNKEIHPVDSGELYIFIFDWMGDYRLWIRFSCVLTLPNKVPLDAYFDIS